MAIAVSLRNWSQNFLQTGATRLVAIILVLSCCALQVWDPPLVEAARLRIFDQLQRLDPREIPTPSPVVIVNIDEKSLAEVGQWPWPRQVFADLIAALGELGARTITFDVLFAEADRLSPPMYARLLEPINPRAATILRTLRSFEESMADAMRNELVVLGAAGTFKFDTGLPVRLEPPAKIAWLGGEDVQTMLPTYQRALLPLALLRSAAAGLGLVSISPEIDGIVRRAPTVAVAGDVVLPGLALESIRVAAGESSVLVRGDQYGVRDVRIAGFGSVPTSYDGRVWIHYTERRPELYIPASDVLDGKIAADVIRDRIVLVGSSAAGLGDIKVNPVVGNTAGVEIQAQLIESMLVGDLLHRPIAVIGAELSFVLVVGLVISWFGVRIPAGWFPPIILVILVSLTTVVWVAFSHFNYLVDGAFPAFVLSIILFWLAMAKYITEEARRRSLRHAFTHYLSPVMVDRLIDNPTALALDGDRRTMTVIFSDIRSFTTLTETYGEDPLGLTKLLNRYFTAMTDEILANQGTIDKYIGDAIMAFWNAPLDDPDHARHACVAVLAMRRRLDALNTEFAAETAEEKTKAVTIRTGFGIALGSCFVGNLGSEQRFNYSVIGDAVNIASRLESSSKTYGFPIIVSEEIRDACPDFAFLEIDSVQLRGRTAISRVYALIGDQSLTANPVWSELQGAHEALLRAAAHSKVLNDVVRQCKTHASELGLDVDYDRLVKQLREMAIDA